MTKANRPPQTPDPAPAGAGPQALAERLVVRLRLATAQAHEAIEQLPIMRRVLAQTLTREDYQAYLHAMADVYAVVEGALYRGLDGPLRERLALRPKLPALRLDLQEQGEHWSPPGPETGGAEFHLHGPSEIIGGLYTLEGATLGGRTIARQLRRTLGPALGAARFLDFHGEDTAAAWKRFSATLDDLRAAGTLVPEEAVAGALKTFAYLHQRLGPSPTP